MRVRLTLVAFLLICISAVPYATTSAPLKARRCFTGWEDDAVALLDDFQQSSCQPCDSFHAAQRSYFKETLTGTLHRVGIMLPHSNNEAFAEPYLITAAVLLMRGHEVTLFVDGQHMGTNATGFREYIESRIPCDAQMFASNLLRVEFIALNSNPCLDMAHVPGRIHCAIEEAESFLTDRLRQTLQLNHIDTLLLDAGMIAGQLAANALGIPVVALLDPDFYDDLLLRRWIRLRPHSLWSRSFQIFSDIWEELKWASSFARYNRIRHQLGLPTIFTVFDIWSSVSLVLLKPREILKRGNISVLRGPLVPPCMPCSIENPMDGYHSYHARAILNVQGDDDGTRLRKELRAFSMARDSLKFWTGSCKRGGCPENVAEDYDFGVARIGKTDEKYFPYFVVPFSGDVTLLDALGYIESNDESVVLLLVDSTTLDNNQWLNDLDPPVLEVDETWTVRELAGEIIKGLHHMRQPRARIRTIKGLEPILAAIHDRDKETFRVIEDTSSDLLNFLSLWLAICLFMAFVLSVLELREDGESLDSILEIVRKQIQWGDFDDIRRYWQRWTREQWFGEKESKQAAKHPSSSSNPHHRRRKTNKKKQA